MRVVFAGTPEFAVPSLRALHEGGHHIALVLTQPDRPAGRGLGQRSSPVKQAALDLGLEVDQPASLKSPDALQRLRAARPDVLVVVAYGLILPPAALDVAPLGAVNVHASLLPRWRGAAPIQRSILAGDRETGITLMRMDASLDTGPILMQESVPITEEDTAGSLQTRLATLGAAMLVSRLERPPFEGRPQPDSGATYAAKIMKSESVLIWGLPAQVIARTARAMDPQPGVSSRLGDEMIKLWRLRPAPMPGQYTARPDAPPPRPVEAAAGLDAANRSQPGAAAAAPGAAAADPGTVIDVDDDSIRVACGQGSVWIGELQRPGGRRLAARDFLRGRAVRPGDRFV